MERFLRGEKFTQVFRLEGHITGRKHGRSLPDGVNYRKVKRRGTEPNEEPLLHGMMNPVQEQASVTASAWLAKEHYNRSKANVRSGAVDYTFPGRLTDSDKIFDVRAGDSMFAFVNHVRGTGMNHPRVFSAINGMSYHGYSSSEDMDGSIKWLGFAMAPYPFSDIGTDKVAISMQVSTSRSIINTGDTDIIEGDVIAMKMPYFNKTIDGQKRLDIDWALGHSGHPKTTRLISKVTKVTPKYITDSMRDVFCKLLIETEKNGRESFYPTSNYLAPFATSRNTKQLSNNTPMERLAISKHNEMTVSGLSLIKVLLENGIIDAGRADESVTVDGKWNSERANKLLVKIAKLIGFAQPDGTQINPIDRKKITQQYLFTFYRSFLNDKMKRMKDFMDVKRGYSNALITTFSIGAQLAQNSQNKVLLNRLDKVIGVVTKGNKKGKVIDGDFGRPKYVI